MKLNHDELFINYVSEFKEILQEELSELERLSGVLQKKGKIKNDQELEKFKEDYVFNKIPTSGRVIYVFRKYWLFCSKLNNLGVEYVNPVDLTHRYLESPENLDLYEVVERMPYYPIGIDKNGNYV